MQPRPAPDNGPPRARPERPTRPSSPRPKTDIRFRAHVNAAQRVIDPSQPVQSAPKPKAMPYQYTYEDYTPQWPRYVSQAPRPLASPPSQPQLIQDIKPRRSKPRFSRQKLFIVMSGAMFVLGIGLSVNALMMSRDSGKEVAGASTTAKDASNQVLPFDQPPSDSDYTSHKASADAPRYVRIPGLRINARAKSVGFSPDSGIEKPGNIYDMGWYDQSGKPGTDRTVVMSARTSGLSADSPFAKLSQLKPGNFVEIERGDGQDMTFKVVSVQPIQPGTFSLPSVSRSAEAGKQGFNIVSYDPLSTEDRSTYVPRQIVYTVRVQ